MLVNIQVIHILESLNQYKVKHKLSLYPPEASGGYFGLAFTTPLVLHVERFLCRHSAALASASAYIVNNFSTKTVLFGQL